jgi:hypothetical protein
MAPTEKRVKKKGPPGAMCRHCKAQHSTAAAYCQPFGGA